MADIPDDTVKTVITHASVPPRLYGLPNIHKEETPLRPTVNCIASPTKTWQNTSQVYSARLLGNLSIT